MPSLSDLANYGTFASGLAAVALLYATFREYRQQGRQKRLDYFKGMIDKFKNTEHFLEISSMLDDDNNPELAKIHYRIRRSYLNFFEELSLMINSGIVQKELALYMFGYYAIRAHKNRYFREEFAFDGPYWSMFVNFAKQMEALESSPKFIQGRFRF